MGHISVFCPSEITDDAITDVAKNNGLIGIAYLRGAISSTNSQDATRSTAPVARRKDPLYGHAEKHKLALGPTVAMGNRLQAAIGKDRTRELMEQGQAGDLVKVREAALYVAQGAGGLVTPSSAVSPQTSRELLLLAIEAFDDGLVGSTSRSLELGQATDALFSRWADA
jgi:AbiV family abortive infection protein